MAVFRLDNILQQWAELYQPLSHKEKDKDRTYFRIGSINADSYFMRNFSSQKSPCMAYVTHIDAEIARQNNKAISYRHVIYFLVKQEPQASKNIITDEEGQMEARFTGDELTQDLIAFLTALKNVAAGKSLSAEQKEQFSPTLLQFITEVTDDPQNKDGLRGLQTDAAHWGTLPLALNGWHVCGLTIEQIQPRLLCLNPEKYL